MTQHEPIILTYEDYELLPDDGRRYEIHEGELSVTPAPSPFHQREVGNLYVCLRAHVNANLLGEVLLSPIDCMLDESTIVQPDVVFMATEILQRITRRGVEGPPTLAIEVVSPYTSRIDRVRKRQLYAKFGVPFYWIVDREARAIEACTLQQGQQILTAVLEAEQPRALPPFPDLILEPAEIFA